MIFVVTLIALLVERFFDWSHLRRWNWYTKYQHKMSQRFAGNSPYLILILTIVPLLIIVLAIEFLLKNALFGLLGLLFQLFIFLYCLGPQNLWADTFACINALVHGDPLLAVEKLNTSFGAIDNTSEKSLHMQLLNNIFIEANRRVFAIVFWFMILGPVGAVLYRTLALSASAFPQSDTSPELTQSARSIEVVMDWIPVRLFTCVFALAGHFVKVVSCWRKKSLLRLDNNETLLMECGAAALGNEEVENTMEGGAAAKNAVGLLDRSFVITLVFIAFIVLLF